ncbi:SUPPRESSOR OF npr1-1 CONSTITUTIVE 1 protein [Nymphaea thermarum]|nr:SUPPRESSOR OF npr1-1 CONSTITUTIVE 1 protein [Nymphaea thermarum]
MACVALRTSSNASAPNALWRTNALHDAINKLLLHSIPKGWGRRRQRNLKPQVVHGQASLTPKACFNKKYRGWIYVNDGNVTFSGIDRKTRDELKNPKDEPKSKWCLKEVTESVECGKEIIPVFFGVEPSDVCSQTGLFKSAFEEHESNKKLNQREVRNWREALKKVGSLRGFTLKDMNWDEAKLKRAVIERVSAILNKKPFESRELFMLHAFNGEQPQGDYVELSNQVVAAACGLPLTLKVIGSLLSSRKDVREWNYTLENLKRVPFWKVQQRLKLSYDNLDYFEKEIFLDISCFFIGENRENATYIAEWFENMPKLRYLQAENVNFQGTFPCFPTHLKWLRLERCHFDCPPSDFNLEKLVILDLYKTNMAPILINQLSLRFKAFERLKVLSLCGMETKITIDFTNMPSLVKLKFLDCSSLTSIDESIGKLKNLTHLSTPRCILLQKLPDSICQLSSLEILHLQGCVGLASLPERLGELESLKKLDLSWTRIEDIPDSICQLNSLKSLNLSGCLSLCCLPERLGDMEELEELILDNTRIEIIPDSVGQLRSLRLLSLNLTHLSTLSCRHLQKLPDSIWRLSSLEALQIRHCHKVSSLPKRLGELGSLKMLDLTATSIEKIPDSIGQLINLCVLCMVECKKLSRLPDSICQLRSLEILDLRGCLALTTLPERLGELGSLVKLDLGWTQIEKVPCSVGQLKNLREMLMYFCQRLLRLPDSICRLSSLEVLGLDNCNELCSIPEGLGDMKSLKKIDLSWTRIEVIPDSIGELTDLVELSLCWSKSLDSLPDSICKIKVVEIA